MASLRDLLYTTEARLADKPQATLSAMRPTVADNIKTKLADFLVRGGMGAYGANRLAGRVSSLAELVSPVGNASDMQRGYREGRTAARRGDTLGRLAAAGQMALAALPIPGPAKKAAREAPKTLRSIIAYHGSPHSFDRFSMDKIGTGEGAQAYGHGLYFAENEAVARGYRDQLSGVQVDGLDPDTAEGYAYQALKGAGGDVSKAIADHMQAMKQYSGWSFDEGLEMLRKWQRDGAPQFSSPGSMYQVRIDADSDDFLDWDKPLSEQSSRVHEALAGTAWPGAAPEDIAELGVPGQQAYQRMIASRMGGPVLPGGGVRGHDAEATRLLRDKGVAGIRYLDQGSRNTGEGSRNFVVFDDKLVTILKKYGWVPGVAVPAALLAQAQAERDKVY